MQRLLQTPDYCLNQLTRTELMLYEYFKHNYRELKGKNITLISTDIHCSPALIISMLKKIGYSGFSEFKISLNNYSANESSSDWNKEKLILKRNMLEISQTVDKLELSKVTKVAKLVCNSQNIIVIAAELTDNIASEFVYKLEMLDKDVIFIKDKALMEHKIQNNKGDLIIIFSLFANSTYIYELIKQTTITTSLITCNPSGIINKEVDIELIGAFVPGQNLNELNEKQNIDIYSRVSLNFIAAVLIELVIERMKKV